MITKRIIPCLDVRNGRVVKGTNFEDIRDVADPVEMARLYNAAGADELVFYDITASFEGRTLFTDILTQVASEIFIPLTVGGGIHTLEDFDRVLKCGADKVSVNSGALQDPGLITDGVRNGFDLEMLDTVAARVHVPIIASGGAGKKEDFLELFHHKGIDAGLAAGIFHQKLLSIADLKAYLNENGIEMRV